MGWRGTLRSVNAAVNRMEREAARRQRELARREKEIQKMQELERAAYEVELFENHIERMTTVHSDCGPVYEWGKIAAKAPPRKPIRSNSNEKLVRLKLTNYRANFFDRLFKLEEKKRARLESNIQTAIKEDDTIYSNAIAEYNQKLQEHNDMIELASNILSGNLEYYTNAVSETDPFSEVAEIGSRIEFNFIDPKTAKAVIFIHDEKAIPRQMKSLLKSGKLSIKDMPVGKYNELYQDYVCSSALRVGRELFALLPLDKIIVTAKGNIVNQINGKKEHTPLLSVLLLRETMVDINFDSIDPSECMKNFKHNMDFKKTQGMSPVSEIEI